MLRRFVVLVCASLLFVACTGVIAPPPAPSGAPCAAEVLPLVGAGSPMRVLRQISVGRHLVGDEEAKDSGGTLSGWPLAFGWEWELIGQEERVGQVATVYAVSRAKPANLVVELVEHSDVCVIPPPSECGTGVGW